ncbi:MAG TPA: acylphosphatase [Acidobacteriota bacterium]|jgi:acylphosphatase|nr:acylphosphatase [Acidobacteriota bacterium]HNR38103.1 acylphosphatase [Acidobacteriota bacterium]HNU00638.1 acylphosphatase [Acidobacteriota bacterium]HOB53385.1 acylphosphatase [Acidobacteriota bacterium]HPB26969.1 acylphosphatase [Acidobacteriota bacterium]
MPTRFEVSGLVQGVGYRYFVYRQAVHLGLRGFVRNQPDGSVEVVAEGTPDALRELEDLLRRGPAHAQVTRVVRCPLEAVPVGADFRIEV